MSQRVRRNGVRDERKERVGYVVAWWSKTDDWLPPWQVSEQFPLREPLLTCSRRPLEELVTYSVLKLIKWEAFNTEALATPCESWHVVHAALASTM